MADVVVVLVLVALLPRDRRTRLVASLLTLPLIGVAAQLLDPLHRYV